MRAVFVAFAGSVSLSVAYEDVSGFDGARGVLEKNCVECHTPEEAKGGLNMSTANDFRETGDSGGALVAGKAVESGVYKRVILAVDDDERMPPKKHGEPLSEVDIAILKKWIDTGAEWPEGEILTPTAETALPRWDAPVDPEIISIEAFPKEIRLETKGDFHRVIVIARMKDSSTHDITHLAKLSLADEKFAGLRGNLLVPREDGETSLKIIYRGLEQKVLVQVKDAKKDRPISFQLDVMPVITAAGCNTGSCHGAARGQDGFHLTLYGFDPKGDHFRLTEEMMGRRINLAIPEESLLVTKATGEVPHTGGKLFKKGSPFHTTLVKWIRGGAKFDEGEIAQPTGIEVLPKQVVVAGKEVEVPFTVLAKYSDGTDRDVTTLSTFSTSNENSVGIGANTGLAVSGERGEAFLLGRFHTFTEGSQAIVVPADSDYEKVEREPFNYVDELVSAKLDKLQIIPSGLASDEVFLRRAFLDVIGLPPTLEEREKFIGDGRPDKRARLIDELLERPEFTEMWVMKWAELLQIRTVRNGPNEVSYKAALKYYEWLRERIDSNMPFNELVVELLSAKGGTFENPATNFYQLENDTLKLTENVAQVFMGTRIQCAQCHNHPFDRWTMDDYYQFSAFFAQVKRKRAEDPRERVIFDNNGEMKHPVTKKDMIPKFLGGEIPEIQKDQTRRESVAKWLASPENPWFAKNVVNIIWDQYMGVGIVDPVDDVRVSNPPSNPELLEALAGKFVEYDYDFQAIIRDICNSRTYQLSTETNATNENDDRNFSKAMIRRVRAEVLLDTISQVTETSEKYKGLPKGARAVQIADGNTSNYFLRTFGRASRATVCSCEVKMEPNLSQALHLINGDTVHQRIKQGKVVQAMLQEGGSTEEIIDTLYLKAFSRKPTDGEKVKLLEVAGEVTEAKARRETLEDIFWALLNSKEFIFNH
ncbi:PSD1 and planctomycete cytochrome C domain-containing protein [Luteolibacter sp. AS25]|uniref:PSD1 and planctomycete cytochrome C domain-containing protein n=1 Tax=Luteolibacter sp. AS25 TaxID=3135776 RepID=UPI00398B4A94